MRRLTKRPCARAAKRKAVRLAEPATPVSAEPPKSSASCLCWWAFQNTYVWIMLWPSALIFPKMSSHMSGVLRT